MKKTYIAPAEKIAELNLHDSILMATSDVSLMSTSLEEGDEQLVKEEKNSFGSLWDEEW